MSRASIRFIIFPMPKVSAEHLAARRRQILDAALERFSEQGFHRTSMQAIFEASGLSPGAVYRYFESKEEIVKAIAAEALGTVGEAIEPSPGEPSGGVEGVLDRLLDAADGQEHARERRRLAVQVWGEALHNPEVGEFLRGVIGGLRSRILAHVRRAQEEGSLDPALDPDAVTRAIVSLVQGYIVQRAWGEELDRAAYRAAARRLLACLAWPAPGMAPAGGRRLLSKQPP